jgi:hypothetical protein
MLSARLQGLEKLEAVGRDGRGRGGLSWRSSPWGSCGLRGGGSGKRSEEKNPTAPGRTAPRSAPLIHRSDGCFCMLPLAWLIALLTVSTGFSKLMMMRRPFDDMNPPEIALIFFHRLL